MGAYSTKPVDAKANGSVLFILVDEYKIRVNKHILFSASPYFNAMCNGTLNSAFQNEFRLKKVNPNRVARLIDYINGNRQVMDVRNVLDMLLDAKRLIFPGVIQDCEAFIDKHLEELDIVEVLEIALGHNFLNLEEILRKGLFRQVLLNPICNFNLFEELIVRKEELSFEALAYIKQLSIEFYKKSPKGSEEEKVILKLEDMAFEIDKELLTSASSYFSSSINEIFPDSNEIEVKDVRPDLFELVLKYTKGDHKVLKVTNVLELLETADRFDFDSLVTQCEKLITAHLQCTEDIKYNLLKPRYLELDYFDVLETAVKLSNETLMNLLSRRFDHFVNFGHKRFEVRFLTVVERRRSQFSEAARRFLDKKCEEFENRQEDKENNNIESPRRRSNEFKLGSPEHRLSNSPVYYE